MNIHEKENKIPTKQGILYELGLNKDSGPYMLKDIMQNNPKSISLLTGAQILKSCISLNQTLKVSQNYAKELNQGLNFIENFNSTINSMKDQIQELACKDIKLKKAEKQLHRQLQEFNQLIHLTNINILEQNMPLLKQFRKTIQQSSSEQRQQYYRMERDIKEIRQTKRAVLTGIFKCEAKIIEIQKLFDVQKSSTDQLIAQIQQF